MSKCLILEITCRGCKVVITTATQIQTSAKNDTKHKCLLDFFLRYMWSTFYIYSKTCVKRPVSKGPKIGFQDQLFLNTGQNLQNAPAILLAFIKLPFVIKIFVLFIFQWPFYTCFTVFKKVHTWQADWAILGATDQWKTRLVQCART